MKISLKNSTLNRLLPAALAITIAAAVVAKPGPHRHGTDILHLSIRKAMSNEGVLADAAGQISLKDNVQGNANHQELDIIVKGLETNSTYQLLALVNDDTNLTQVSSFDTDAAGKAALLYRQFGNGHGLGHGRTALPAALNPVSLVRAISIYNDSTQAVLSADLSSADSLQYLMKRDLSTDSVEASLRIKATTSQTQFRLVASGLAPTSDYLLALNGGVVQTNTTDAKGSLAIKSLLENRGDILDIRSVALWDSASNVVLNTTLP